MMIVLSICIPTYNRATYLNECLASIAVAARGFTDQIEVLISDNASSDDTPEVVAAALASLPCIRYERNATNIGAARNCYAVALRASGSHVWLFGDDDAMEPDAIRVVLLGIQNGYEVIICNYSLWDRSMEVKKRACAFPWQTDRSDMNAEMLMRDFHLHVGFISSVIVGKEQFFLAGYEEYSRFLDFGFPHVYSVYAGVAAGACRGYYVADPIVRNRSGNSSGFDWFKYFSTGSGLVFEALASRGYSRSTTDHAN